MTIQIKLILIFTLLSIRFRMFYDFIWLVNFEILQWDTSTVKLPSRDRYTPVRWSHSCPTMGKFGLEYKTSQSNFEISFTCIANNWNFRNFTLVLLYFIFLQKVWNSSLKISQVQVRKVPRWTLTVMISKIMTTYAQKLIRDLQL